jgi:hypothetical protein
MSAHSSGSPALRMQDTTVFQALMFAAVYPPFESPRERHKYQALRPSTQDHISSRPNIDQRLRVSVHWFAGVLQSLHAMQETGTKWGSTVQQSIGELFERQPLLLGALGIAIGAGIAASIPHRSRK